MSFSTQYTSAGPATISLLVCREGRCSDASQTIEVDAPASTSEPRPRLGFLHCVPTLVLANEPVVCNPTINGTVTDYSWSTSPGGSPASGREATFTTTYSSTGTKRISLQACNSGGCSNKLQSVLVGPLPDPLDSDDDGVADRIDNCQFTENPDQSDVDGDGAGDACDSTDNRDPDADGIQTWEDPCPADAENLNGYLDRDGCPEDPEVAVSIEQGDGSVFAPAEAVTICYSAGGPMFVDIDLLAPSGARSDLLSAFDLEGSGDCFEWLPESDAETGEYVVEITGSGADDSATFEIAEPG